MPEVWEQEGHLRAGACLRGDLQEELKGYLRYSYDSLKLQGWRRAERRLIGPGNDRRKPATVL